MGLLLDPKLNAKIDTLARQGLTKTEISRRLGVHRNTVLKYWPKGVPHPDVRRTPTEAANPIEAQRKKSEADKQRKEHIAAVKELAFREWLGAIIRDNTQPMPAAPPPKLDRAGRKSHHRFPLLVLNDWHFEERVASAGVMGLNAYDIETACRRLYRIVRAAIGWKRDQERGGRCVLPQLTVAMIGDFLTGTLHGLERHSDAPNIVRAALACGDLIAMVLRDLAAEWPQVQVLGVVGNHGRLPDDRKVPTKDPTRSWDYLAYEVARRRLANQTNITWELPEAYGVLFEVGGHLCYACHGNFIPNNLGVVGYGVRRFTTSLSSNLQAAGKPMRYAFFGHFHSSQASEFAGIEAFICPSLIGTQEYSFLSGGSVNRSAQELHVFDKDLGHVTRERLYGDGPGYDGAYELKGL